MRIFMRIYMGGKILQFTKQVRSKSSERLQLSSNKPAAITTSRKGAQIANIAQFWTLSKLLTMLHLAYLFCVNFWHLYFSLSKKVITRQSQHVIIVALPALLTVNRVHRTFHNVSRLRKPLSENFQTNWKEKVLIQNQYISRPRADKVNMTSNNNCVTSWLCNKLPMSHICSNAN